MNIAHERLVNGLLKGFGNVRPEDVKAWLSQDIEIVAPRSRATSADLWPAIWALAAVLERELYGRVYIRCGLGSPLPAPSALGPRCHFVEERREVALSISLGVQAGLTPSLVGDACDGAIAIGRVFEARPKPPTAIECFALAGFLGFAVIARFTGIPEYRADFTTSTLKLDYDSRMLAKALKELDGFTCIGMGQVGQATLALLFFLYGGRLAGRRVALIDDDGFQSENGRTQLLLADGGAWCGQDKVSYVAPLIAAWGVNVEPLREKIHWTWRRGSVHPPLALLGLHDLEARRMACAAGFERIIESGVGTNLVQPRISWHALPGDAALGKRLFAEEPRSGAQRADFNGGWVDDLKSTPGSCGWVEFMGISATAPCLGAAAAAFALAELGSAAQIASGSAMLWSQCIAPYREHSR